MGDILMKIHLPTLKLLNKTIEKRQHMAGPERSRKQKLMIFHFSKVPNPLGNDTTEVQLIFCI